MVDAPTAVGIVGMIATILMILAVLYLTFLGARSERHGLDTGTESESEPAAAETE